MAQTIILRKATKNDIEDIVQLMVDDPFGKTREIYSSHTLPQSYFDAFDLIDKDPNQLLMVAIKDDFIVGTFQLTIIPYMSFLGSKRALIESVRTAQTHRNQGIGKQMMEWAIAEAKARNCRFIQLTSNKERKDAHRFYIRLGFTSSHEGFKMDLQQKSL